MIGSLDDIHDLIGETLFSSHDIMRDKSDFSPEFWDLKSGLLGELAQKLVNYKIQLTLSGDFTPEANASRAFSAYISELSQTNGPIRFSTPPVIHTASMVNDTPRNDPQ